MSLYIKMIDIDKGLLKCYRSEITSIFNENASTGFIRDRNAINECRYAFLLYESMEFLGYALVDKIDNDLVSDYDTVWDGKYIPYDGVYIHQVALKITHQNKGLAKVLYRKIQDTFKMKNIYAHVSVLNIHSRY